MRSVCWVVDRSLADEANFFFSQKQKQPRVAVFVFEKHTKCLWRRRAGETEVGLHQIEVEGVDYLVTCEVGAVVVAGLACGPAERWLEDVEILGSDEVVVVAVGG